MDPALRTFEVLELGPDKRYAHALSASEGALEEVPGCGGLRLDLDALWAEIDRLGPAEEPAGDPVESPARAIPATGNT